MNRKHYQLIAATINQQIRKAQTAQSEAAVQALYDVAYGVAVALAQDNPSFNHFKFMTACGAADQ